MKGFSFFVFLLTVSLGIVVLVDTSKKTGSTLFQKSQSSPQQIQQPREPNVKKLQVGETFVWVKIARTPEEQRQGLSGVKFLAKDEGMLFVFDRPEIHMFWMKDMNFPLDFIWVRDGQVVSLSENVPVLDSNGQISRIQPNQPVDQILEVNSGFIKKNGIKIGSKTELFDK